MFKPIYRQGLMKKKLFNFVIFVTVPGLFLITAFGQSPASQKVNIDFTPK